MQLNAKSTSLVEVIPVARPEKNPRPRKPPEVDSYPVSPRPPG